MFNWLRSLFKKEEQIDPKMKYLIVGLGNMHPDYDDTRHNIGFEIIDVLAAREEVSFKHENLGDLSSFKLKGRTIYLLKPSTYMNRSGKAVRYWMQKLKIEKDNLLVVVDDLNLDFGKIRLRGKGSDGGHNGLKDIQNMIGGSNYPRLRVGIGDDFRKGQQVDFVLGKWSSEEREGLDSIYNRSIDAIKNFSTIGLKFSMDRIKN